MIEKISFDQRERRTGKTSELFLTSITASMDHYDTIMFVSISTNDKKRHNQYYRDLLLNGSITQRFFNKMEFKSYSELKDFSHSGRRLDNILVLMDEPYMMETNLQADILEQFTMCRSDVTILGLGTLPVRRKTFLDYLK